MRIRHKRRQPSVVGRLQQRAWTAADGSARSVIEVVAEELGPSLTGAA
jgi:single-stranded DNA-binding protein